MSCQFVSMPQNVILLGGVSTSGSKPSAAGSVREGDAREQGAAFRLARNGTAWKRSVADFAATRSGQRGSNSLPGIPRIGSADSQEPCRTSHFICALPMGRGSEFAFYKKAGHPNRMSCFSLERATRLELASRYPTNRLCRFVGALPDLPFHMRFAHGWRQRVRFLQKNRTSESDVLFQSGAGNETRTRFLLLGKVALYQMSYARENRSYSSRSFSFCQQFFQ